MDWKTYVNSLEKITIEDIPNIIKDDLEKKEEIKEKSAYGFKQQRNNVLFGKYDNGVIPNPYLFLHDNDGNTCQDFYNMLQNNFPDVFNYNYRHYTSGEYDYYGVTDDDNLEIEFPNLNSNDQEWIFNQVNNSKEIHNKTR